MREDRKNRRPVLDCSKSENMTKQSFKDDCDINEIVKRHPYQIAESAALANQGMYDDILPIDYHQAMNISIKADRMFSELPSEIRNEFRNDPAQFFEFVNDPKNSERIIELGLAKGIDKFDPQAELQAIREAIETPPPAETIP